MSDNFKPFKWKAQILVPVNGGTNVMEIKQSERRNGITTQSEYVTRFSELLKEQLELMNCDEKKSHEAIQAMIEAMQTAKPKKIKQTRN